MGEQPFGTNYACHCHHLFGCLNGYRSSDKLHGRVRLARVYFRLSYFYPIVRAFRGHSQFLLLPIFGQAGLGCILLLAPGSPLLASMSLLFLFRTLLSPLLAKGLLFLFFLLFGLRFGGSHSFGLRVSSSPCLCLFTLPCFFLHLRLFLGFRSPSSLLLLLRQSQGLSLARSFSIGGTLLGFRMPNSSLSALNHPTAPSF